MLKRIEVENFKSLKHLDYSCAKLNLLMGLREEFVCATAAFDA